MIRRAIIAAGVLLASGSGPAVSAPFDKSGIADWTVVPPPAAERTYAPPVATRLALDNGMAVLVVENHSLPIIALQLLVPGAGSAADPRGRSGLAAFTADMIDEGAGGLSALAIADELARLGTRLWAYSDSDAAQVSLTALSKNFEPTLAVLAKLVTQPAFDPGELARVKGDRVTALEQRRDRPPEIAQLVLQQALFGSATPYGHPIAGVRSDVAAITAADVTAFYREHWNPAVMTVVVVGDVSPKEVKVRLDAALGSWRVKAARPLSRPVATPAKLTHRLLLVDRPGAAQSDVRIGVVGPDRADKRFFAFEVARMIFGGSFTSRITQRLREQLGIIYHANARMDWRVAPGPLVTDAAIVTGETATGVSEVMSILDDLASHEVPAAELDKAKQNLVRALPAMFDTNAETAAAFVALALHRLPDDWYAQFADGIRKVTAGEVAAAVTALLPSRGMAVSIVGDLSKIRPALDRLGLGSPAMYDRDGQPVAPAR